MRNHESMRNHGSMQNHESKRNHDTNKKHDSMRNHVSVRKDMFSIDKHCTNDNIGFNNWSITIFILLNNYNLW